MSSDKINVEYIGFFQTPYDRVKYIFPGMDKSTSLSYNKFKEFFYNNFKVNDIQLLNYHLDSFDTIIFFPNTGDFKIIKTRKNPFDISFKDLVEYNKEKEDNEKKLIDNELTKTHNLLIEKINSSFDKLRKKKNGTNKFKRIRVR